jgi:hypothetical protein
MNAKADLAHRQHRPRMNTDQLPVSLRAAASRMDSHRHNRSFPPSGASQVFRRRFHSSRNNRGTTMKAMVRKADSTGWSSHASSGSGFSFEEKSA